MLELVIKLKDADEADIVLPVVQKMIAEGYTASINPMYKKYGNPALIDGTDVVPSPKDCISGSQI